MSLIHTAELNQIAPFDYLVALQVPGHPGVGVRGDRLGVAL
jgi:hypothetical protein